jgi:hypothetical protein
MALTSQAGLIAALEAAQNVLLDKQSVTVTGSQWGTTFPGAGNPPAGTLAGTSTAAGVVPTSADAGFPFIRPFGAGKTGYLAKVEFAGTQAGRMRLCDMLFKAGAYNFNALTTLAAQPSYSGRLPGTDYKGTELWFECVTAFTGSLTLTVNYTNQDGTTGRSTGAIVVGVPAANRLFQLPLQSGDSGIQKIESVTATVATVGTFNLLVVRPLWMGRNVFAADFGAVYSHGPDKTDLPIVFDTSALFTMFISDGNSNTGTQGVALAIIES